MSLESKTTTELPHGTQRKRPDWLRVKLPLGKNFERVRNVVSEHRLHTICQSGSCPNMGECWGAGTATFMILGNVCTRSCSFCAVLTGRPEAVDMSEPDRVADAIRKMGVKHAVITSVNRDELPDKGASVWNSTVRSIKRENPETTIETLIPDVQANWNALDVMISPGQEVVSHNIETVERLYRRVRPQGKFSRSLEQIHRIKLAGKRTKSGIMVGLGETEDEVYQTMDALAENGTDIMTLGQYLRPSSSHIAVAEYVHPDIFKKYQKEGIRRGIKYVESGPLVRSSYHAERPRSCPPLTLASHHARSEFRFG